MEQLQVIREIILGFRCLTTATLFIFVLYTLFFLHFCKNLESENKILLKSLAVTFFFICLLCAIKHLASEFTTYRYPDSIKYIIAGNILQFYLPIQIYTLQRFYGCFFKLRDVIILSASIFIFNSILIAFSFVETDKLATLHYFIQVIIIAIIIYQFYTLSSSFKDILSVSNKNSFFLKADMFLFIIISIIVLFTTLSLFSNINPYKREPLKLILGFLNLILLARVLYYSSCDKFSTQKGDSLNSISSLSENDFFNQKKDEDLKNRLLSYFEKEKPYLNPQLTINEVALYLYSNKTYLSRLINDHYNNNFSQFVNFYRIKAAKDLFSNDNQMTIHQLCDLSGFGSMATFTMAFRLYVGNSPAEWCKGQRIMGHNETKEEEE